MDSKSIFMSQTPENLIESIQHIHGSNQNIKKWILNILNTKHDSKYHKSFNAIYNRIKSLKMDFEHIEHKT